MIWNYRLAKRPSAKIPSYGIYKFYYDETGRTVSYCNQPMSPFGDNIDEIYTDVMQMVAALDKGVVNLDLLDRKIAKFEAEKSKNTIKSITKRKG